MRPFTTLAILAMLASPGLAFAQDAASPPPPDQPGMQPPPPDSPDQPPPPDSPDQPPPPRGGHHHSHDDGMMQKWQTKFESANTTHDGRLTLQQAEAAGMKPIVAHFTAIDTNHRGYVTFNEIMAWRLDDMAQKLEHKAAELRAQDQ